MAQTTLDALFGPVLIIPVIPVVYLVNYNCMIYKHFLIYQKRERNKKKDIPVDLWWRRQCQS